MNEVGRPVGGGLIDDVKLLEMRKTESRKKCAEYFGVTQNAIRAAEVRIKEGMNKNPSEISTDTIDAMSQLRTINEAVVDQLRRCSILILKEEDKEKEFEELEKQIEEQPNNPKLKETLSKLTSTMTKNVLAIQSNLVSASAEIRKQIELQLKIAETLYNLQMMAEFQSEVIDILKELDPFAAQKFINKLKDRRAIRGLVKPG